MKKLYSLVLMATALLIGTNMNAADVISVKIGDAAATNYESMADAFAAVIAAENATVTMTQLADADYEYSDGAGSFTLSNNSNITWDLAGKTVKLNKQIFLNNGELNIMSSVAGAILNNWLSGNTMMFFVRGSQTPVTEVYSNLIIGANVTLNTPGLWWGAIFHNGKYTDGKYHAYGAQVEVYGNCYGQKGFTINGNIQDIPGKNGVPENALVPNILIHDGAILVASEGTAIYAAGYGTWTIEGSLTGTDGIYAKSGVITLDGAELHATGDYNQPQAYSGGYHSTGSGITYDTHSGYAGGLVLNVSGDTEVTSDNGYAVMECVTKDAAGQPIPTITIESGTFTGAEGKGSIITTDAEKTKLQAEGTISGGNFDATVVDYLGTVEGTVVAVVDPATGETTYVVENINPADKKTDLLTAGATDKVILNSATQTDVTLTGDKEVAYLALAGKDKVIIPSGLTLKVGNIAIGADGQIEVQAGGKLIVSGTNGIVASSASNLLLETSATAQAILLLNPAVVANKNPMATVEFITKSFYKDANNYQFERFGIPTNGAITSIDCDVDGLSTGIYVWENNNWANLGKLVKGTTFANTNRLNTPFVSCNLIAYQEAAGAKYTFTGNLVGNDDASLNANLVWNPFANSYSANVDMAALLTGLAGCTNIDPTVYLATPAGLGTYTWDPVDAEWAAGEKLAPMQAFILHNHGTEEEVATFDYEDMVWTPATSTPNAAPRRITESDNTAKVRVIVANEEGVWDNVKMTESATNNHNAVKYMNDDVNIYAMADEKVAIVATENLENTYVGFSTVNGGKFTISFANVEGRELSLIDHETGAQVAMVEGATYEFTAAANSVNDYRFEIVGAAKMPTAIENAEAVKNAKGIYTITGQYVGEMNVWNTLPAGVYVINGEKRVK